MIRSLLGRGSFSAAPVIAAVAVLAVSLPNLPWHRPAVDESYAGFDPNLVYTVGGGQSCGPRPKLGTQAREAEQLLLCANSASNLVTTTFSRLGTTFSASFDGMASNGSQLTAGVWGPWTGQGYFIEFRSLDHEIRTVTIVDGRPSLTLAGGHTQRQKSLGHYSSDQAYQVTIRVDKSTAVHFTVESGGNRYDDAISRNDLPDLFASHTLSLSVSTSTPPAETTTTLSSYRLTLYHERLWADKVSDSAQKAAAIALVALSFAIALLFHWRRVAMWFQQVVLFGPRTAQHSLRLAANAHRLTVLGIGLALGAYLVGNALLFPLGGHPFDIGDEKIYAYVAQAYGPSQLYYLPNTVPLARMWNGVAFQEAAFPYLPVMVYLSTGIGWLFDWLQSGRLDARSVDLEYAIKAVNVLFGLIDAALIYLILRQLETRTLWSLGAAALFLFNPAVWFSMSVWGQTHVISLAFVLAAILAAERQRPFLAWLALAGACLTRPQMLVFGFVLGLVFLRKFPLSRSLIAASWAVVCCFVALLPVTLGTSLSLPADVMANNIRVQEAGGNAVQLTTVSQDAYSVWPLVTYVREGASGLRRQFTPSSTPIVASLTYQRLSQVLTTMMLLVVGGALFLRERSKLKRGSYLPLVALAITSFLMLLTGTVATHFILALPILLLCHRWLGTQAYAFIAIAWTVTTFVPMFGDMGNAITSLSYPLLSPAHNVVTRFFVFLYSWDRFITVGVVANISALVWLTVKAFRVGVRTREIAL